MKQSLKKADYITIYLNEINSILDRSINRIKTNSLDVKRIPYAQRGIASFNLKKAIVNYTFERTIKTIIEPLIISIDYTYKSWNGFWKLKNSKGQELNQYILSAYDEMLWMLSLGFLLDIPNEEFQKLVNVIDKDGVKDNLFEFIIRAKLPNRKPIEKESYQEFFGVPKVFEKLRLAIKETDKTKAEMLIKEFITKEWYKNHKDAGWYNSHKSKHNTYFGYWSFETAAVVAIMDLDDSSFKDCEYYPKDLVDYYRKNHSAT